MSATKLTIIVSGMIAADPHQGGATWAILQYLLGLQRLGHDVYLIEPVSRQSIRPEGAPLAASVNASYFRQVAADFGLEDRMTLIQEDTRETVGRPFGELVQLARRADVLVNVSGMLTNADLIERIPVRIYLDLDPAFVQIWQSQGIDMRFAGHTHFVTVGQAIGQPDCSVPTCGRQWLPTLQPVVLSKWPLAERIEHDSLTTIGNWRGYGSVKYEGVSYGQKAHSLRQFMRLPTRTTERFVLALAIHPDETADLAALAMNGWNLTDPAEVAGTPADYWRFVRGSKAEFGIAKSGYAVSRCGWFSDRSACYLASGRPVIAQDTGFSNFLPTGKGLFTFTEENDVLKAIEELRHDYRRHARAARVIAEDYFDSDKVLTRLLQLVGAK